MTEMTKLIVLLAKNDIPFEVRAIDVPLNEKQKASIQILSPSCEKCEIDAVCHEFSYGGENGLIEIMCGWLENDRVLGYLTAEEAFEYFKELERCD